MRVMSYRDLAQRMPKAAGIGSDGPAIVAGLALLFVALAAAAPPGDDAVFEDRTVLRQPFDPPGELFG